MLRTPLASLGFLPLLIATGARAQCGQWQPGLGYPGTAGTVLAATMWDPDGSGPLPARLVLAGDFRFVGNVAARRIAVQDPVTGAWSGLGGGLEYLSNGLGSVTALTTRPNGDLIAGGFFSHAGGVAVNSIARWDGSTWSPLGNGVTYPNGFPAEVDQLATMANGDVVVAGLFTAAGGLPAVNVARWDGVAWSTMGGGIPVAHLGRVRGLVPMTNGDVVAAGEITGGAVTRWNGTSWQPVGSSVGVIPYALAALPNGDLMIGHDAVFGFGVSRWNGTSWSGFGGFTGSVRMLKTLANGDVLAGGSFTTAGSVAAASVARWNGVTWAPLGAGVVTSSPHMTAVEEPSGSIVVGGYLYAAGGASVSGVARWNGTTWSRVADGIDGSITALARLPGGDVVAGGTFRQVGSVAADYVARWDGTAWSPLGGWPGPVHALAVSPTGELFAGGSQGAGGRVARWTGTQWVQLGASFSGAVFALDVQPNGELVAGGQFLVAGGAAAARIARWNGVAWLPLGTGVDNDVHALATLTNGDLAVGGVFYSAGGQPAVGLARWNGTAWSTFGPTTFENTRALLPLANGGLIAGGAFGNGIARWDGSSWSPLGTGLIGINGSTATARTLTLLPDGDVVAGGSFTVAGGVPAMNLARWDGATWTAFGAGLETWDRAPLASLALPTGTLLVGGHFELAGGLPSHAFARWTSTCPATAVPFGTGCTGSAGPLTLAAASLPWIGTVFTSVATGLPASSLAIGVLGLGTTSIPAPAILPQGTAGCTLWVTPDVLQLYLPSGGSVTASYAIADNPALIGFVFHQQVMALELDANGIVALTGTNALTVTKGAF